MEKKFKLRMTTMPNFIAYEVPGADSEKGSIAVSDLTAEEAKQYSEWMAKSFMTHWESKAKSKTTRL